MNAHARSDDFDSLKMAAPDPMVVCTRGFYFSPRGASVTSHSNWVPIRSL
jgi:hypothetical protein